MEFKWSVPLIILVLVNCDLYSNIGGSILKECPYCNTYKPSQPESRSYSSEGSELVRILVREIVYLTLSPNQQSKAAETRRCCGGPVSDHFQSDQFEKMFSNRSSLEVEDHEIENKGFLDYQSFITASAFYQPYGFGTTYINQDFFGTKEVAAFLAHVATKTSCGNKVVTREQLSRDLCNNKEMNSNLGYCDEHYKNTYPCAPGVAYYDRGALPIYWNYNYGEAGKDLKVDLLNHPEYIEQNATLAFQVAIWRWMTPIKEHQPSAHEVFIGTWTPTKSDNLAKRVSGFGATMNVLYGDLICGHGDNESMNNIISHYLYYLDLMGINREEVGPHEVLSCAKQVAFNPSISSFP
ncbi:chitinase-like protein 1 [Quercus lobata]|uniref:Glycoside hydrolase family 19 catalytic domain-containing protein n=1 Tax=Quercus lobata TaxID=97700 RepID=A0A7N2L5T6_QUELO|nr:chitinase-like protein 1 [Quercus lobata]